MEAVAVPHSPILGFYLLAVLALGGVVKRISDGGRILSGGRMEERHSGHGASPAAGLGGWTARESTTTVIRGGRGWSPLLVRFPPHRIQRWPLRQLDLAGRLEALALIK